MLTLKAGITSCCDLAYYLTLLVTTACGTQCDLRGSRHDWKLIHIRYSTIQIGGRMDMQHEMPSRSMEERQPCIILR